MTANSDPYPFTDDDIEKYAAELLGIPPEDSSDDGSDSGDDGAVDDDEAGSDDDLDTDATDDGDEEEGDDSPSADPSSSPDDDTSTPSPDPTASLDPATLLSYAQFDAILKSRPDAREFFTNMLEGREVVAPTPTPTTPDLPTLPELDDDALADPAIRALYDSNRATLAALAAERARVDQLTNVTTVRTQQEFTARAMQAKADFASANSLNPAQVEAIAKHADELGVSQSLLSNTTDITSAVTKALELARWDMPEYRTDAIETAVKERTSRSRKRQKLAGVGGGSGGTPRDPAPKPLSDADRRAAMIADVADQWFGQTREEV